MTMESAQSRTYSLSCANGVINGSYPKTSQPRSLKFWKCLLPMLPRPRIPIFFCTLEVPVSLTELADVFDGSIPSQREFVEPSIFVGSFMGTAIGGVLLTGR